MNRRREARTRDASRAGQLVAGPGLAVASGGGGSTLTSGAQGWQGTQLDRVGDRGVAVVAGLVGLAKARGVRVCVHVRLVAGLG